MRAMYEVLRDLGAVSVVAPDSSQSAIGHAITLGQPMLVRQVRIDEQITAYSVDGRPADCIKLALQVLLDGRPDLVISGINDGANVGIDLFYSGTVAAAAEAALLGLPAMAISLQQSDRPDFAAAARIARQLIDQLLAAGLGPGQLVNINIPALSGGWPKGVRLVRQSNQPAQDRFELSSDACGGRHYCLVGGSGSPAGARETDLQALDEGYVTVTPVRLDLTDESALSRLSRHRWRLVEAG